MLPIFLIMQDKVFVYQNANYTIRPVETDTKVILFKVLKPVPSSKLLELQLLYGWVDKKLVELTARDANNSILMDTFSKYIISQYHLS